MHSYKMIPEDVLFFRDGKPFGPVQKSLFPPPPSTVYGACQAMILFDWYERSGEKGDIKSIVREAKERIPQEYGSLELKGPWLQEKDSDLFPCPMDIRETTKGNGDGDSSEKNGGLILPYEFIDDSRLVSDKYCGAFYSDEEAKTIKERFITAAGLKKWCEGKTLHACDFVSSKSLWALEHRVGIKVDDVKGTAEEGQLFSVDFVRPTPHFNLAIRFETNHKLPGSVIRLGGEGRTVTVKESEPGNGIPSTKITPDMKKVKLMLVTPAFFSHKDGIFPNGFDEKTGEFSLAGVKLRLKAVIGGEYAAIGGWDSAENRPVKLRRAVLSGTVYYCEVVEGDPSRLNGVSFTDNSDDAKKGFGTISLGVWK